MRQGKFCYVLTSRQMGKSSLMVRTGARLREEGATVAILDLTRIGQNLTPEQWYEGLLGQLGDQINLTDELEAFWQSHDRLGPLDRWMRAVREVVLPRYAGQIAIFVDEIDFVRSLPFSTDEFFAAIREFYNHRTDAPNLERLTFCLLGVATPSDLIRDTRTTPFNIGQRIELNDFTEPEAAPLAEGLGRDKQTAQKLLSRILYWTGGHPYLTQQLCQAVAEDARVTTAGGVDHLCEELFFTTRARERDDNLLFVRERMLRSEGDLAGLLDLYAQVRNNKRIRDDETNPLVSLLRLSGVARVVEGRLYVRNRIYYRVFDRDWVLANMPDAELRRQQTAYRRGLLRAAAIAAVIVLAVGSVALFAWQQRNHALAEARRADVNQRQAEMNARQAEDNARVAVQKADEAQRASLEAERQRSQAEEMQALAEQQRQDALYQKSVAEGQRDIAEQQEYVARMLLAPQSFNAGDLSRFEDLLAAYIPRPGKKDLRGFEWYFLWRASHDRNLMIVRQFPTESAFSSAFSPDGLTFASGSGAGTIKLWNVASGQEITPLEGHTKPVAAVAFSPDGRTLASGSYDSTIKLWNVASGREITTLKGHTHIVWAVAFSPDGRTLTSGSADKTIKLWNTDSGREITTLKGHNGSIKSVAFSPDGLTFASGSGDGAIKLWNLTSRQEVATLKIDTGSSPLSNTTNLDFLELAAADYIAFSPDGRTLASGIRNHTIKLWNVASGQEITTLKGHTGRVEFVAFGPDGRTLASGSADKTIKLWNIASGQLIATLRGHTDSVNSIAFTPDGKTVISGGDHGTFGRWNIPSQQEISGLEGHTGHVNSVAFSPDGRTLASGSDDKTIKLWNIASGQEITTLKGHTGDVNSVTFSSDGRTLASGSRDSTVKLWNVASRQEVATLKGHTDNVTSVAFAPDGRTLASGSNGDKTIKLWNVASGQEIITLKGHTNSVVFSPDGRMLASGGGGGGKTIKLWNVASGQEITTLKGHTGRVAVSAVAFSPDGRTLASGSYNDTTITLWNVASGQEVATLKGHTGQVISVAFSPDGRTLASGGNDARIFLWNVALAQQVFVIVRNSIDNYVAFSPDGKTLASGSSDKTIRVWHAATEEEVQRTMRQKQAAQRSTTHLVTEAKKR